MQNYSRTTDNKRYVRRVLGSIRHMYRKFEIQPGIARSSRNTKHKTDDAYYIKFVAGFKILEVVTFQMNGFR